MKILGKRNREEIENESSINPNQLELWIQEYYQNRKRETTEGLPSNLFKEEIEIPRETTEGKITEQHSIRGLIKEFEYNKRRACYYGRKDYWGNLIKTDSESREKYNDYKNYCENTFNYILDLGYEYIPTYRLFERDSFKLKEPGYIRPNTRIIWENEEIYPRYDSDEEIEL